MTHPMVGRKKGRRCNQGPDPGGLQQRRWLHGRSQHLISPACAEQQASLLSTEDCFCASYFTSLLFSQQTSLLPEFNPFPEFQPPLRSDWQAGCLVPCFKWPAELFNAILKWSVFISSTAYHNQSPPLSEMLFTPLYISAYVKKLWVTYFFVYTLLARTGLANSMYTVNACWSTGGPQSVSHAWDSPLLPQCHTLLLFPILIWT